MNKKFLLFILTLIFFIPGIFSQDTITKIIIERIYISKHPQAPDHPQFLIYSKNNNFQMGFGGYAKLSGIFDFDGVVHSHDFITYDIPVGTGTSGEKRFHLDAHQSRIYTEVLAMTKSDPLRIYIEADFYSLNYTLRLRHAYGQYKGFLVGQTWSSLMDLDATPNTVDFEGPNSEVSLKAAMIRYTLKLSNAFTMLTALEQPDVSMTYQAPLTSSYQYIPDLILTFKFHAKRGHLQAGGVFRTMTYKDSLQNKIKNTYGYGCAISGLFKLTKKDNFMFQGVFGNGIAKYIQDISGVGLDALPDDDKYQRSELSPVPVGGFYCGYQHFWHPKLNSTLVYGFTKINYNYSSPMNDAYRLGQYASVNLFWNVFSSMTLAIEYLWGERRNWDKETGNTNRINFMAQYNF